MMWVCLVGFGRKVIFLWVRGEILGDGIICCGGSSMWLACVGDFDGSMDVWCVLSDVVASSGRAVILFVGCLFDGFSGGNSSEINCGSRRAAISSLHSLIRRRNSVKHSLKSDIVG